MSKKNNDIAIWCAHDAVLPLSELKPNPRNPNKHPPEQIKLLAKIIGAQGWRNPIVVSNRSGLITKGHGRLEAALLLGTKTAPVDYQDYGSESEELSDMIADNRIAELAEADRAMLRDLAEQLDDGAFDMDLTGFDQSALEELMTAAPPESDVDAEPQIDRAEELAAKWKVKRGQVWELGEHRLMCGDSTKIADTGLLMADELADILFTSPPYAQQRDYKETSKKSLSDWDGLMRGVISAALLSDSAQILVNLGLVHREGEWIPYWNQWIEWMRSEGWRNFGWYVWDQQRGLPGDWNGRFAPSHEFIFHFNKEAIRPIKHIKCDAERAEREKNQVRNGSIKTGLRGKSGDVCKLTSPQSVGQSHKVPDSVWRFERHMANDIARLNHPATFPTTLPAHALRSWNGIAYEPFTGSGTTIIACEQLGRKCRAMEIDPGYTAVAIQRWADATGKTPKLLK